MFVMQLLLPLVAIAFSTLSCCCFATRLAPRTRNNAPTIAFDETHLESYLSALNEIIDEAVGRVTCKKLTGRLFFGDIDDPDDIVARRKSSDRGVTLTVRALSPADYELAAKSVAKTIAPDSPDDESAIARRTLELFWEHASEMDESERRRQVGKLRPLTIFISPTRARRAIFEAVLACLTRTDARNGEQVLAET